MILSIINKIKILFNKIMAITSGTKINFYNTDLSTFTSQQENVKDGSLFFINDGNGHGGRIYSGSNLVANVGFEEFSVTKSGNGSYITGITPTSSVSDDGTLTLGLTLSTGTPAAAQNNYATVNIAAASTAVTNQTGLSSVVTVGPNTTSDTLTFTPGNKWITLYGSANGDSITVSHLVGTISGGTAGTVYGPTAAVTQTAGTSEEIMVPQLKVDEAGHVTQVNHYKLTVVDSNDNSAKAYFSTLSSNDVSLHIGPAASATSDGTNGRGVTFSQGTDITFTRNSDAKLTINHATISPSVTEPLDAETVKPGQSKTITWLDNFGLGSNGHVSGYSKKTLNIDLTGLTNAIHWKGSVAALPSRPASGWVDYATGDVIAVGGKEYILDNDTSTGITGWREFGDEGNWVPKTRKVLGDGTYLTHSGTGVLSSDVTISHKTLLGTGTPDTSYGTDTKVPQIKVDAAGHIKSISEVDINFPDAVKAIWFKNNDASTGQLTVQDGIISPASSGELSINAVNKWIHLNGDQEGSDTPSILIAHDAPGKTPVTTANGIGIGATTVDGQTSWTFSVITDVSTDEAKHVTYIERKPISIYSDNSDHAYLYLGKTANPTSTLASGWTSNNTGAFINVKSTQDTTSAVGDDHNIKIIGAKDVSVDVTAKGVITVQHSNAAITANTTNGFKTFAVDAYGHVTSYTAKTATTFTVKADNTSVAAQTDFETAQTLNFAKPSTSAADATKLKISGTGSSTGVTYDFGPVWQTL